jgi:hypothetical protein
MFVNKLNPFTGLVEKIGGLLLIGIPSEKWLEYTNAEGVVKHYKLANAQMVNNGVKIPITVSIAKATIDKMSENGQSFNIGETYLSTLTRVESTTEPGKYVVFARMSHLQGLPTDHNAILEALGSWEDDTVETVAPVTKEVKVNA